MSAALFLSMTLAGALAAGPPVLPAVLPALTAGGPALAGDPPALTADSVPSPARVVELLSSEEGRAQGLQAVAARARALPPARATLWVQLLAVVERSGWEAGGVAARAVVRAEERDPREGVRILLDAVGSAGPEGAQRVGRGGDPPPEEEPRAGGVPPEDFPSLVSLAAHLMDGVDRREAGEIRRRLIAEWPDSVEAPEAQLLLARYLMEEGGTAGRGEAVEILEAFLIRRPSHPLAPEARRLRQRAG